VGWKLFLAGYLFLPAPEAMLVDLIIVIVVDVEVHIDIEEIRFVALANIEKA
jgi:hypothetical protein